MRPPRRGGQVSGQLVLSVCEVYGCCDDVMMIEHRDLNPMMVPGAPRSSVFLHVVDEGIERLLVREVMSPSVVNRRGCKYCDPLCSAAFQVSTTLSASHTSAQLLKRSPPGWWVIRDLPTLEA